MLTDTREPAEFMPMIDTYSPVLHRLDQAVRWRAVHPTEPVPPPYDILTRYSKPPEALVAKSKGKLDKLVAAANVKKGKIPGVYVPFRMVLTTSSTTQSPISKAQP